MAESITRASEDVWCKMGDTTYSMAHTTERAYTIGDSVGRYGIAGVEIAGVLHRGSRAEMAESSIE